MLVGGQTDRRSTMSAAQDVSRNGRGKRPLSAEEKLQIWQQLLTGELTQRQAAEQWNVDPTTIMRNPPCRSRGCACGVGAVAAGPPRRRAGRRAGGGQVGDRAAGGDRQGAGDRAGGVAGKIALGLVGPVAARVEAWVKQRLLELLGEATAAGWSFGRSCRLLGLSERRARYWQQRAAAGLLADHRPGGVAVHALRPEEITAILALADEWGEIDGSHRKLAHRGCYLGRVWVSEAARPHPSQA